MGVFDMYTISLNSGPVLTIHRLNHKGQFKTFEDVEKEASQRTAALCIGGKLLDARLKVLATFNSQGKKI
jgi:hypothetical protein